MTLALEQILNGFQFGIMLFLMAAGLTLIFGIMNVINLAHGSLYMIGAYGAALVAAQTGSFLLAVPAGLLAAAVAGLIIEFVVIRKLYDRDHLQQVLATFGLILFINEGATILFGRTPLFVGMPPFLSGSVEIIPGIPYPTYRIAIMVVGLAGGARALSSGQQDAHRHAGARGLDPSRDGACARRRHPAALHGGVRARRAARGPGRADGRAACSRSRSAWASRSSFSPSSWS